MKTFLAVIFLLISSTCFAQTYDFDAINNMSKEELYREIARVERDMRATQRDMDNTFMDIVKDRPARIPNCAYVVIGGQISQQCW